MSEDLHIDGNLDTSWDDVGDLRTTSGVDQIHQAVVVTIVEDVGLGVSALTDDAIEEKRGDIENAVASLSTTRPPVNVTVADVDYDERVASFDVQTQRVAVTLTAET